MFKNDIPKFSEIIEKFNKINEDYSNSSNPNLNIRMNDKGGYNVSQKQSQTNNTNSKTGIYTLECIYFSGWDNKNGGEIKYFDLTKEELKKIIETEESLKIFSVVNYYKEIGGNPPIIKILFEINDNGNPSCDDIIPDWFIDNNAKVFFEEDEAFWKIYINNKNKYN